MQPARLEEDTRENPLERTLRIWKDGAGEGVLERVSWAPGCHVHKTREARAGDMHCGVCLQSEQAVGDPARLGQTWLLVRRGLAGRWEIALASGVSLKEGSLFSPLLPSRLIPFWLA